MSLCHMCNQPSNVTNKMNSCEQPMMHWKAKDLCKEWRRFKLHVEAYWEGPLYDKEDVVKINFLKLWIGDEGRELFENFKFQSGNDMKNSNFVLGKYEHFCHHKEKSSILVKKRLTKLLRDKNYQLRNGFGGDLEASRLHIHSGISKAKNDSSSLIDSESRERNEMKSNGFEQSCVNKYNLDLISDDMKQTTTNQDSEASKNRLQCVIRKCHQCGNHSVPSVCVRKNKDSYNSTDIKIHSSCQLSKKSSMTSQHQSRVKITGDLEIRRCCSEACEIKKSMAAGKEGMSEIHNEGTEPRGLQETDSTQQHTFESNSNSVFQTARPCNSADGHHCVDVDLEGDNDQTVAKVNRLYKERPPDETNKSFLQSYDSPKCLPDKCTSGACEMQFSSELKRLCDIKMKRQSSSTAIKTVPDFNPPPGASITPGSNSNVPPGSSSNVPPGSNSNVPPGSSSNVPPGSSSNVPPGVASATPSTANVPAAIVNNPEPVEKLTPHETPSFLDDNTHREDWPLEIMEALDGDLDNDGPNNWKVFMKLTKIKFTEIYNFEQNHKKNRMQAILMTYEKFQNYTIGDLKNVLRKMKREQTVRKIREAIQVHNLNES